MMYGGQSQFDGNAAFSGGGFMPSQATQTIDSGISPAKNRDSQRLTPFTVKQIAQAYASSDDKSNILIDGVDVNNITLVGIVCDKVDRQTEVAFTIDDGTGRLDCKRWLNEEIDAKEMAEIQEGMYVRMYGHLRGFHGQEKMVAFSVRPITNFNEVSYHFIECVYVHVYNTKSQMQGSAQTQFPVSNSAMGMNGSMGYQTSNTNLATNSAMGMNGSTAYQAPVSNQFVQQNLDGIKDIDKKVLEYLHLPANLVRERGVHVNEIVQHLKYPPEKIMNSIRDLETEGAIYSTIDDSHFKSAVNG
ncbi:hypothetical protein AQUCO_09600030v1 [Aquilegia coerulea]|uniref:Uncharacterized protein n=1 Tax=Aquilegia coerulea TaxID=218851 RepID=A0A2G5C4G7_AQUCA|nr:hypothetical protein AQUCO_09600030v1 [Aquilegia coerulea]